MKKFEKAVKLRIMVDESIRSEGRPLYEAIVYKARELNLAGATVLKGIMGYGSDSTIHTTKILRLSEDMPLVIEIVDETKKIEDFLVTLDQLLEEADCGGLVTIEQTKVMRYTASKDAKK